MAKIDVSRHGIRVILNRCFYTNGTPQTPLDVEGTVLFIETHSTYVRDLVKRGDTLKILCTYELELANTYALVRWDNDVKYWVPSGVLVLRSSKLSRCKTIWDNEIAIAESTVPFAELNPESNPPKANFSKWTDDNKYTLSIGEEAEETAVFSTAPKLYTYNNNNHIKAVPMKNKNPESIDQPGYIDIEYQPNEQTIPPLPPSRKRRNLLHSERKNMQDISFSQIEAKVLRASMSEEEILHSGLNEDERIRTYRTSPQIQKIKIPIKPLNPKTNNKLKKKPSTLSWGQYKELNDNF